MHLRNAVKRLILCAGLAALAAPLRAGEAAWVGSADNGHTIQIPAAWFRGAGVPGLGPKGMPHAYSLMPASRAYALDIAAEDALNLKGVSAEAYFDKARRQAGNPPALRAQLPDNSLFEFFRSSAAVKGRANWRVQGVLYKYVQRYYLTFSSARGYPGDKDWKAALALLATLDPVEPSASGWQEDFLKKLSGAGLGKNPAAGGGLLLAGASRDDGTQVSLEDIALFGCKNFLGNVYLFNEDRTAHCWVASMADYKYLLANLPPRYWQDSQANFAVCPEAMRQERACDTGKLRRF